jgi:DUF1680 family protein
VVIEGEAAALDQASWGNALYRTQPPETRPTRLRAIPYFAWDNREPGAMQVWLPVA